MDYTTDDALNILFRCGIQTVPTLLKHLRKGGFKIAESTLEKKLLILKKDGIIEDQRVNNSRPPYFDDQKLKKFKTIMTETPEASAPNITQKGKFKCSP